MASESESPAPGCLLILLQLSASMKFDLPSYRGEFPKSFLARLLADEIVEDLVVGHVEGVVPANYHISIVGYSQSKEGPPDVSLLPDDKSHPHFLSVAQLVKIEVPSRRAADQPRKWTANVDGEGEPAPVAALATAHWIVQRWQADHPHALSPIIVHCCDGEGFTGEYDLIIRSLAAINSPHLVHCVFSEAFSGRMMPFQYSSPLAEPWQRLWKSSAEFEPKQPNCRGHLPRALTINEWPRAEIRQIWQRLIAPPSPLALELLPVDAAANPVESTEILELPSQEKTPTSEPEAMPILAPVAGGSKPLFSSRSFSLVKRGNDPEQWEDAFCIDADKGMAAICDGAGAGIFCRQWAALLAERWVRERPDFTDPKVYRVWLDGCRNAWMDAIGYKTIRIFQRMKVDDVGAAATMLGLRIEKNKEADYCWEAVGVGDTVLFWTRGNDLLAAFPLTRGSQFDIAPLLLRSKRIASPGFARASGICKEGDRFILATDAVAHALFDEHDRGPVDWTRFDTLDQGAWEKEMDRLRDENRMVNDDCTLIVLQVGVTMEKREAEPNPVAERPPVEIPEGSPMPALPEPEIANE